MRERLQKIIASAGISSRRAAEQMIVEGRVSVNNAVVRELGAKADIDLDEIRVDGKLILPKLSKVYIALHKPPGYVTTLRDPWGRAVVTDLISGISERIFPVGRLDYDSEGLLLLTNDGDFSLKVQHPRYRIPKTYMVKAEGNLTRDDLRTFADGVRLNDGIFRPEDMRVVRMGRKNTWLEITIAEGKKRVIRRALESVGHPVMRLIRTAVAGIKLGRMEAGKFRHLSKKEVEHLLSFTR
ncbi:MAG TPA: pseudouridine synthase [Syntrophales bacterium]|nr:pseudouridine synthase [Syntrophales bacterium]